MSRSPRCRSSRRCTTPTRIAPTTWRREIGSRRPRRGERAANAELLPTLRLDADYGTIGQTVERRPSDLRRRAPRVRVPIFEGGKAKASRLEAEARCSGSAAPKSTTCAARIDLEVRDVDARRRRGGAAARGRGRHRDPRHPAARAGPRPLRAGVADNLEVTQAQESLARAADYPLDVLYRHNVAKAALARAVGIAEQAVAAYHRRMK